MGRTNDAPAKSAGPPTEHHSSTALDNPPLSQAEADRLRDEVIRRMANTPPEPKRESRVKERPKADIKPKPTD